MALHFYSQKELLLKENVEFKDCTHVNIKNTSGNVKYRRIIKWKS